tara:strand:- start:9407 stop:10555 length:1149 start_codon:yes stop_codon:yes gene_type:complete
MASVADVKYSQMRYEENRALGEGLRKQQEGLDQKRNRMGWGRAVGNIAGTLLAAATGPIGIAAGAGFGSWLGSTLGGASVGNVDEVEKGKLFKHTADEARKQGIAAQDQMKSMAVTSALTDAASAFIFSGTDLGQAVQSGAQKGAASAAQEGANLLQRSFAGAKGGLSGGYGHVKAGLQSLIPEGDYVPFDTLDAGPLSVDPNRIINSADNVASMAVDAPVGLDLLGTKGYDLTTKGTFKIPGYDQAFNNPVLGAMNNVAGNSVMLDPVTKAVNEAASKNVIPGALEKISKNYPGLDEITGAAQAVDPSKFTSTPLDPYSWYSGASQNYGPSNLVLDAVNNTAGPTQSFSDFRTSGATPPLEDQNAIQQFFGKHFVNPFRSW